MFYLVSDIFFLLRSTALATKNEQWAQGIQSAAPATQNHHRVPNQKWRQFHKTRLWTLSKCRPDTASTTKKPPKPHLILAHTCRRFSNVQTISATPATRMRKCPMPCVSQTKCPGCPSLLLSVSPYLFISLSLSRSFPLSPSLSVSIYLSASRAVYLSLWLSISIYIYLSLSTYLPIYLI